MAFSLKKEDRARGEEACDQVCVRGAKDLVRKSRQLRSRCAKFVHDLRDSMDAHFAQKEREKEAEN